MSELRPSDEDIQRALDIEKNVDPDDWVLYLKCLNGKPMSERTTDVELRNGCILTNHVFQSILDNK